MHPEVRVRRQMVKNRIKKLTAVWTVLALLLIYAAPVTVYGDEEYHVTGEYGSEVVKTGVTLIGNEEELETLTGNVGNIRTFLLENNLETDSRLTVSNGNVELIIANNVTLSVNKGIRIAAGSTLTIYSLYGSGDNCGRIVATGDSQYLNGIEVNGGLIINGGIIEARGYENGGAGIFCEEDQNGSEIRINGGRITAVGGENTAGIGSGDKRSKINKQGGKITIGKDGGDSDLYVEARGGANGAGIGGGYGGDSGNITINRGTVRAYGGEGAAGIGGGNGNSGREIHIHNGDIEATGGIGGAGIGGGKDHNAGTVNIKAGNVSANGGSSAFGIGGGKDSAGGSNILLAWEDENTQIYASSYDKKTRINDSQSFITDTGKYVSSLDNVNGSLNDEGLSRINGRILRPSYLITFKVNHGFWNDGTNEDKKVLLKGLTTETVTLSDGDIPAVGNKPAQDDSNPNLIYLPGRGQWNRNPDTTTPILSDKTYIYSFQPARAEYATVIFKVKNGSFNDGTKEAKTVYLRKEENADTALVLTSDDIPGVGGKPDQGFKAGAWKYEGYPMDERVYSPETTTEYTYEYEVDDTPQEPETYTITFDPLGGRVTPGSKVTGTDGKLNSLPTPSRNGYIFKGWWTLASDGEQVTSETVFDSDKTVYAHWEEEITPKPDPDPEPEPAPAPVPVPVDPIEYQKADLNGLTLMGPPVDIRIYGPLNRVSFNGLAHVFKDAELSGKQKKTKCADLNIGVKGIPGYVKADFSYGKNMKVSEKKAYFTVNLKEDTASASYNALDSKDRIMLKRELKKINKVLKDRKNRRYFSIDPLNLSEFAYDTEKSAGRKKVFSRRDGSADTIVLVTEERHYIESLTVKTRLRKVLNVTLSGNEIKITKREFLLKTSGGNTVIKGKDKNLTGTMEFR